MKHLVRIAFQDPEDRKFAIRAYDSDKIEHRLSREELDKLLALNPDMRMIIVMWSDSQDYSKVMLSNSDHVNYSKLSDETLDKISDERPLQRDGLEDVINSMK